MIFSEVEFVTHDDGVGLCRSVCPFIRTISQKIAAARITKLDINKCSNVSAKNKLVLGSKGQKSRSHRHENNECWLLLLKVCRRCCRDLRRQDRVRLHVHFFVSLALVNVVSIVWYSLVHYELLSNPVDTDSVIYRNPVRRADVQRVVSA